jgi:hypothetical protein
VIVLHYKLFAIFSALGILHLNSIHGNSCNSFIVGVFFFNSIILFIYFLIKEINNEKFKYNKYNFLLVLDVYYCISVNIPFFHLLEIRYFIELYNKIEEFIIYN